MSKTAFFGFLLLITVSGTTVLYAQKIGALAYQDDIRVVKTEWFDIIYPAESAPAAAILKDNVDALYVRAASLFGTTPDFRMPIVITPANDQLNGYFNPAPYNHIVLYDAIPDYNLAHNEVTLISVVYHELIHAVTMSKKGPVMRGIAGFFGDPWGAMFLNQPPSFYEGTAVFAESNGFDDDGGRLNSDFALHPLRQAKIEGRFPAWDDTTGFRDTAPRNLPYIMGGAFSRYLVDTYGLPRFTAFWEESAYFDFGFSPNIFQRVYGESVRTVWASFADSLRVPAISADNAEAFGRRGDVFPVNLLDDRGIYHKAVSAPTGVAYLDDSSGTVYFLNTARDHNIGSPRSLFTLRGARNISLSRDGAFVGISRNTQTGRSINDAVIFEIANRRFIRVNDEHIRDTAVVTLADGRRAVAAVKSSSQSASLVYYLLNEDELRLGAITYRYDFRLGAIPFNPVDIGFGRTAFLCKDGSRWTVAVFDPVEGRMYFFDPPDPNMEFRDLNVDENGVTVNLHFAWTKPGSLPRMGALEIDRASLAVTTTPPRAVWRFLDMDISGGMYSPAPLANGEVPGLFVYVAKFFKSDGMYTIDTRQLPFITTNAIVRQAKYDTQVTARAPLVIDESYGYNPFRYWNRPLFLPVPIVPVRDQAFTPLAIGLNPGNTFPVGITLGFDDPGDSLILALSLAQDLNNAQRYVSATLYGGGDPLFANADLVLTFAQNRFLRINGTAVLSSLVNLDANFTLTASNEASWSWGEIAAKYHYYTTVMDTARFRFSNVRRYNKSHYASGGITFAPFYQVYFTDRPPRTPDTWGDVDDGTGNISWGIEKFGDPIPYYIITGERSLTSPWAAWWDDKRTVYQNLGAEVSANLPQLLPFSNPADFTFNVPLGLGVVYFPNPDVLARLYGSAILFGVEIQRGIPGLNLFVRRFSIQASVVRSIYRLNKSLDFFKVQDLVGAMNDYNHRTVFTLSFTPEFGLNTGALVNAAVEFSVNVRAVVDKDQDVSPYAVDFSFALKI